MTANHENYRPCVGIMLLNKQGRVFVGHRVENNPADAWQMPQGGIELGEDPQAAALRELQEEVGCNNVEVLTSTNEWLFYDLPIELQGKLWGGDFVGQRQLWFLMRFLGSDEDINIATSHPEFSAWRWVDPEELPKLIVPFKRELYKQVLEIFSHYIGKT